MRGSNSPCMHRGGRAFGQFFAEIHLLAADFWLSHAYDSGRRLGWLGCRRSWCVDGGEAKEEMENRGDVKMQKQKQKEGGERENQSGGCRG